MSSTLSPVTKWSRNIADYDRLMFIQFESQEDLEAAIDELDKHPDVKEAPFRPVGHETIFVPAEAAFRMTAYFNKAGLKCQPKPVRRQEEMTPEQLERAQRRRKLDY